MKRYVVLNKKRGDTPLMAIDVWKKQYPEYASFPASYAGRLDPMASGKLLVLIGDECKRQDSYTKLDKEYVVELVLDVKTDTGDVLGLPSLGAIEEISSQKTRRSGPLGQVLPRFLTTDFFSALAREVGAHSRKYPVFSSKTVNGKPLFLYALENKLGEIQIPEHIERIYKIKLEDTRTLNARELEKEIMQSLSVVPRSDEPSKVLGADFRQDEIREKWIEMFKGAQQDREFQILKIRVTCASGAYMRTLAERIGTSLGTTALALSIDRTKIGRYIPVAADFGVWTKTF